MAELLDKISSYNIFNFLLPGIVFVTLATYLTPYSAGQHNVLVDAFLYYFVGLIISRFGSIVLEPLLKRLSFVRLAEYSDFVAAEQKDSKMAVLLEVSNTYRTLSAMLILLLLLKGYVRVEDRYPILKHWDATTLTVLLLVLFVFSFRKQTRYITKRIKALSHH